MSEDISRPYRLREADAAHISGPPKHHRDTSSKGPQEAEGEEGMKDQRWYTDYRRRTWGAVLKRMINLTSMQKTIQVLTRFEYWKG